MALLRLALDEHGQLFTGEEKIKSLEDIQEVFTHLTLEPDFKYTTKWDDKTYLVEVFDAAIIAQNVEASGKDLILKTRHQQDYKIALNSIRVDEWDRFYGLCIPVAHQNIPSPLTFVLTEPAQNDFFNQVEAYDDDSFTFQSKTYSTQQLYNERRGIEKQDFWCGIYQQSEKPGWDLSQASPIFKDMLPRLKLHRSKIIVLGCGEGHDAALFAEHGHIVTAVDFSATAIEKAKARYSHLNIQWIQEDVFKLSHELNHQYDLVIEHTCYCAIPPNKRADLAQVWGRLLHSQGQLMAVFFTMPKYEGPPFGATEWEIRKRLEKKFQFLFWNRSALSIPSRLGKELFVFAQKK